MTFNAQQAADHAAPSFFPVDKLLNPRSIAIVGVSPKPGSPGATIYHYLKQFNYTGQIYLVSRNTETFDGIPCVKTIDELPEGVEAVVLCVPQTAVLDSLEACARRKAKSAVVFAAGFAEAGEEGIKAQQRMKEIAEQNQMAIAGPNCLGLTSFVDGVPLTFAPGLKNTPLGDGPGLCVLTQSGGMMSNLREAAQAKGIPLGYAISTGNEAVVGVEDYLAYMLDNDAIKVITMFVEQIRKPQQFIKLAVQARQKGKTIVMLHPGKSAASREAAKSHTGSLVGDYTVIRTLLEHEAVIMVDTMEELMDVSYLLMLFDRPPVKGTAILTDSGAFKGYALDFCEEIGLPLPKLSDETEKKLDSILPGFTSASNPLDITAQALIEANIYTDSAQALMEDPAIGSLLVSVLPGSPQVGWMKGQALLPALSKASKPVVYVVLGEGAPLADQLVEALAEHGIPLFRSAERAMQALAIVTRYGEQLEQKERFIAPGDMIVPALSERGVLSEYVGKQFLQQAGIKVPRHGLATDVEQALKIAEEIGYPVVLKAQSSQLAHKSDVGGVMVGLKNEEELTSAWEQLQTNIRQARPDLTLDGVLVEQMADKGIEMVVGARRDEQWGPIVMVGLGGIWIEVLKDVRFIPPGLNVKYIVEEILKLRSAPLLLGARGAKPADVEALAQVVMLVGQIMKQSPQIKEIDINPLVVLPKGEGAIALDALIVAED